ncbi:hypothetical protein Csa_002887, partial [Cucumis sativus]
GPTKSVEKNVKGLDGSILRRSSLQISLGFYQEKEEVYKKGGSGEWGFLLERKKWKGKRVGIWEILEMKSWKVGLLAISKRRD